MAFYLFYSFLKSESQIWQNWFDQLRQYGNTVQTGQLPSMTQYAVRKDRMTDLENRGKESVNAKQLLNK